MTLSGDGLDEPTADLDLTNVDFPAGIVRGFADQ
jgi:hypothetical protein